MPLNISVVPGKVFVDGELVVTTSLNALGQPVITITGSVGGSEIAAGGVNATHVTPGPYFNAVATGSANAYVVSLPLAPSTLADGLWFSFRANAANTGPVTVNVNGLGAKALVTPSREAMVGGEITNGQEVWVQYDGSQFQMVSPRSMPLAFYAVDSGVANAYVVTLAGVSVSALAQLTGIPITVKASAACTGACTLAVNGLAATAITKKGATALSANDIQTGHAVTVVFDGTQFQLVGAMDAPALPSVGAAGSYQYPRAMTVDSAGRVTAMTAGVNNTTVAVPAKGSSVTFTHGLGALPSFVRVVAVMGVTTEQGYTAGDEKDIRDIVADWDGTESDHYAFQVKATATAVVVTRVNSAGSEWICNDAGSALRQTWTASLWTLRVYAF